MKKKSKDNVVRLEDFVDESAPSLGLTGIQIAITLVLNGIEPEEAKRVAFEFAGGYGNATMADAVDDEILEWARIHRVRGLDTDEAGE